LFRNDGPDPKSGEVRFTDVTKEAGLDAPGAKTMGAVACDFDLGGDLDVFTALDPMPNALWRHDGNATGGPKLTPIAAAAGVALDKNGEAMASMHGTVGDVDGDLSFDLFVPILAEGCLYRSGIERSLGGKKAISDPKSARAKAEVRLEFTEEGRERGLASVLK